ncbi:MAG: flagellar assembly peptidoglycan hydrolase FlgJ [Gammaproteobacteria bacterium]|nr:flagellar assembly peptidoglycan hydrolase FlgJ [Gammaproteobacteria bacterium]
MTLAAKNTDFYYDSRALDGLRQKSRRQDSGALQEVAKKFESIFMKMMIKSMREASEGNPLFDSEGEKFYTQMYDDQLSVELTKGGSLGLADMIVRQMEGPTSQSPANRIAPRVKSISTVEEMQKQAFPIRNDKPAPHKINRAVKAYETHAPTSTTAASPVANNGDKKLDPTSRFIHSMWPHAQKAAKELNLNPEVLIAQAALETGWGKHVIHKRDGESSHNLFNIKADNRWDGDSISRNTMEFIKGKPEKERAQFRAYASVKQSFDDYVNFLKTSDRYQSALKHGNDPVRFVKELQAAGYATDPKYADKIANIMGRENVKNTIQQLREREMQLPTGLTG